jgi:hypothetical protein
MSGALTVRGCPYCLGRGESGGDPAIYGFTPRALIGRRHPHPPPKDMIRSSVVAREPASLLSPAATSRVQRRGGHRRPEASIA